MSNTSGMGWEAEQCRIIGTTTTWDAFLEGKPKKWHAWKNKRFPQYDYCVTLFGSTLAVGDYASSSTRLPQVIDSTRWSNNENDIESAVDDTIDEVQDSVDGDTNTDDIESEPDMPAIRTARKNQMNRKTPQKRLRTSMWSTMQSEFQSITEASRQDFVEFASILQRGTDENLASSASAVTTLQMEPANELSIDEMIAAFDVMKDAINAAMFLKMTGEFRLQWLMRQIYATTQ
ncbi:hypothetical protein LEN26_009179 [Aphanomyces euteiches]|nr:hypothetical protein LEN26_009179 [Aphanomyces euteiches]